MRLRRYERSPSEVLDNLDAQWSAYDRLTPEQRAAIDVERIVPVHETRRLLARALRAIRRGEDWAA